jgi:hypothetical protein
MKAEMRRAVEKAIAEAEQSFARIAEAFPGSEKINKPFLDESKRHIEAVGTAAERCDLDWEKANTVIMAYRNLRPELSRFVTKEESSTD